MGKLRRFVVEVHEEDIEEKHLEDLLGEVSAAIGSYFLLDDGVGYGVMEVSCAE